MKSRIIKHKLHLATFAILVIGLILGLNTYNKSTNLKSHAAGTSTSSLTAQEAEDLPVAGSITIQNDPTASGGKYLQLGLVARVITPTTTPSPTPLPTSTPMPTAALINWPNSSNTGIPQGTILTPVIGGLNVTVAGQVISDKDITGCVNINADNVTLRRVKIKGCASEPVINVGYGHKGIIIEDCEIDGQNRNSFGSGVGYEGFTIQRCNIHNTGLGVHMTNNVTVEVNWIHDLYEAGGSHNDNIVTNGGSNFIVRGNNLENSHTQTANVALYGDFAAVSNALVENNLLQGGGYSVYGGSVDGKPYTSGANNIRFLNNRFTKKYWPKGGYWGPVSAFDPSKPGNVWSGNIWDDTGSVINP